MIMLLNFYKIVYKSGYNILEKIVHSQLNHILILVDCISKYMITTKPYKIMKKAYKLKDNVLEKITIPLPIHIIV